MILRCTTNRTDRSFMHITVLGMILMASTATITKPITVRKKYLLKAKFTCQPSSFMRRDDGGGAAGLEDFWELFWKTPNSGGGFTWVLTDEGIVRTDLNGFIDVNRVNAPDGVVGPHRAKKKAVITHSEKFIAPVKISLKKLPEQFEGKIPVENRYHFTNLKDCRFEWQLVNFSTVIDRQVAHKVLKSGIAQSPDLKPFGIWNFEL